LREISTVYCVHYKIKKMITTEKPETVSDDHIWKTRIALHMTLQTVKYNEKKPLYYIETCNMSVL
jgi:hypothetical protein